MVLHRRLSSFGLFVILVVSTGLLFSCGGGGGSNSTNVGSSSSGTGSAALLLADGPAEDYDHIWIWITQVTLLPEDGSRLHPVVLFRSNRPEGYRADLLDLRDQDLLLTIKDRIPTGKYAKIRLEIADIMAEAFDNNAECSDIEIKLPSGKIDLNPRGGLYVRAGQTLAIRLDVDANKSIQLKGAGKSGKCIFRPVVFVDISPVFVPDRCPRMLKGTIDRLFTDHHTQETIGFRLNLGDGRSPLRVNVDNQTAFFDADASIVGPEALSPGDPVNVRGRLDGEGEVLASMVVIGAVIRVKGIVTDTTEVINNGTFVIDPDPGQSIIGDALTVALVQDTAIYSGCDTPVESDFIQVGMGTRIIGKLDLNSGAFKAVAVFLTPRKLAGTITGVTPPTSGTNGSMTLQVSPTESPTIIVPYEVKPYLVGDGEVPWSLLKEAVDCERYPQARVFLDPDATEDTAAAIEILPKVVDAEIGSITLSTREIITSDGQIIHIQLGAFLVLSTTGADTPVSLSTFEVGDTIRVHGVEDCGGQPNLPNFKGFILFRMMTE